jgi:XTP/dITP diphosphohydrolase
MLNPNPSGTASLLARRTVVVATSNKGKMQELRALLADLPIDLVAIADAFPTRIDVVEDGKTFEENAIKKARAIAAATALPTLADDSGLEVDALRGAPGVYSARYSGEGATDAKNNVKLLAELDALDAHGPRAARFRCVLALVDPHAPDAPPLLASGSCEGRIAPAPRGNAGFGYDPIFVVTELPGDRTMAELTDPEKNALSHRARAVEALRPALKKWLGV